MVELLYGGDSPLVSRFLDELRRPRLLQRFASHHALLVYLPVELTHL